MCDAADAAKRAERQPKARAERRRKRRGRCGGGRRAQKLEWWRKEHAEEDVRQHCFYSDYLRQILLVPPLYLHSPTSIPESGEDVILIVARI
uniref:Uncharacterized protein n=1 Tax=Oryza meridionalis TaxID=40149 RepID=A0A0E0F176_9ORYZ